MDLFFTDQETVTDLDVFEAVAVGDLVTAALEYERTDENAYRIEIAVAGFRPDELDIEVKENLLTVQGRRAANDDQRRFLHRGLAERNFERRFQLADYVKVTGASLVNGLLTIELARHSVAEEVLVYPAVSKKISEDEGLVFSQVLMQFAMGNAVTLEDTNGNRKLLKKRQQEKIDNVAAMMDAYIAYKANKEMFE